LSVLEPHADGVILTVRAAAGARRTGITGERNGMLKVSVAQAPEKGKANKAIIDVLAEALSLKRAQLELLSGATSPQKRFLVRGIAANELAQRIARQLGH